MPENPARWRSSWSKMECIHGQSLILCTMKSATTSAPTLHCLVRSLLQKQDHRAQMKPTAHWQNNFSVLVTTPCPWLISFSLDGNARWLLRTKFEAVSRDKPS